MKGNLIDLIPTSLKIEIEDIGHLFWRYFCQSQTATPHEAVKEWISRMNDVCNEEWGEDLKLSVDLATIPTYDLVEELKEREGVTEFVITRNQEGIITRLVCGPPPGFSKTFDETLWGISNASILVVGKAGVTD
jgi:hypothetical protein